HGALPIAWTSCGRRISSRSTCAAPTPRSTGPPATAGCATAGPCPTVCRATSPARPGAGEPRTDGQTAARPRRRSPGAGGPHLADAAPAPAGGAPHRAAGLPAPLELRDLPVRDRPAGHAALRRGPGGGGGRRLRGHDAGGGRRPPPDRGGRP